MSNSTSLIGKCFISYCNVIHPRHGGAGGYFLKACLLGYSSSKMNALSFILSGSSVTLI